MLTPQKCVYSDILVCLAHFVFYSACDSVVATEWHVGTVFSLRAIHTIVHDLLVNSPGHC